MSAPVVMSMWGNALVPREVYRQAVGELRERQRHLPEHLIQVAAHLWPTVAIEYPPLAVMNSRRFLCQVFDEGRGAIRLTFSRAELELVGNVCQWKQGISWDDLQKLKAEAGYGHRWAVEIYPPDGDVVNVANMRHLWIPEAVPSFAWHPSTEAFQ